MRTNVLFSGVALLAGMTCFAATDDKKSDPQPDAKSNTEIVDVPTGRPEDSKHSEDEDAIREAGVLFAKAYEAGDAKAVCALFTAEAEYVDEAGNVFDGREAIEASLVEFFAEHPNCRLEMNTETIRFVGPGVAVEDGSTHMICAESSTSVDIDDNTMTWQSVDHEIGGAQQPDSEIVTIVRSAPVPVQTVADDSQ